MNYEFCDILMYQRIMGLYKSKQSVVFGVQEVFQIRQELENNLLKTTLHGSDS